MPRKPVKTPNRRLLLLVEQPPSSSRTSVAAVALPAEPTPVGSSVNGQARRHADRAARKLDRNAAHSPRRALTDVKFGTPW